MKFGLTQNIMTILGFIVLAVIVYVVFLVIKALRKYYDSKQWKQDYADDEAGRLPADLKRGVLSEDGIWNLLEDVCELNERLKTK
jgi:uncharacterized membrane protein